MKNTNEIRIKTCPRCGAIYHGVPALSRQDNETLICPDCGTREALEQCHQLKKKSVISKQNSHFFSYFNNI